MPGDGAPQLVEAMGMNPSLQNEPQKTLALSNANTSSAGMAGTAGFMSMISEFQNQIKSVATLEGNHPARGFFGTIWHGLNAAADAVPSGANMVVQGVSSGLNRVAQTAVEVGSLGTRRLDFNKGFWANPLETTKGGFNFDNVLAAFNNSKSLPQLFTPSGKVEPPGQVATDNAQYNAETAIKAYKADPTPQNGQLANDAINAYKKEYLKASMPQLGTLYDAAQTLQNASPQSLLVGPNNMFFMAAHTAAYVESYAAKYGWGAAIGHMAPAVAVAIMTDGALSADVASVGTLEYDTSLLAETAKMLDQGRALTAEESQAVDEAQARMMQRAQVTNAQAVAQGSAEANLAATRASMPAVVRGLDTVGQGVGAVLKPIAGIGKTALGVSSDVRMNLVYQMAQLQAGGDPSTAALWAQTSDLQARNATGQKVGQDGTALLNGMNLDPHGLAFSILSPIAGLTDFYTKWLAADPFGAVGNVIGRARTAEGLNGYLGRFFGGLRITDVGSAFRAGEQYQQVARAYSWLAHTDSAAEIGSTFPGTYTSVQREALAKLNTYDEVATWHGQEAEALQMLRPMAPQMGVYSMLKSDLRGPLGEFMRLHGVVTEADLEYAVRNFSDEELAKAHINPATSVSEKLSPMLRVQASFARWLGTRFGPTAMYWDEMLGKMENHVFNVASDNAVKAETDLFRVALFPEKLVQLIGNAAEGATEAERLVIYQKAAFHVVQRRMWAGLDTGTAAMMKTAVDQLVWRQVRIATGLDGGGESLGAMGAGKDMAGPGGMSQVFDPETIDTENPIALTAAIRGEQRGQITFFSPRILRGMAITVRKIVKDLPPDVLSSAESAMLAREDIEKVLELTNDTTTKTLARIDQLALKPERGVIGTSRDATQGYRAALGEAREIVAAHDATTAIDGVNNYINAYDQLASKALGVEQLRSIVGQRAMAERAFAPGSRELMDELDRLRKALPVGFGITDLNQLNPRVMRRLVGQGEGFNAALDEMSAGLRDYTDFTSSTRDAAERYKQFVTDNPNAQVNLDKEFTRQFERAAGSMNGFLNPWQHVVDKLNSLLSRTFVPAALFSGAWSFHIAVSESSLNILREGFGVSYEAKLAKSIANRMTGDRTIGAVMGQPIIDKLAERADSMVTGRALSRTGEAGMVAKTVSNTLLGAVQLIKLARDTESGLIMGFDRAMLAGMGREQMDRMISDFVDVNMNHDGAQRLSEINHVSDTFSGVKNTTKQMAYGYDRDTNEPTISHVVQGREWRHADMRDPAYLSALRDQMNYVAHAPVERPIIDALYKEIHDAGTEGLTPEVIATMTDREILDRGARHFLDNKEYAALDARLQKVAYDHIHGLPADFRATMKRDKGVMSAAYAPHDAEGNISVDPHEHWAKAAVYDVLNTVGGERNLPGEAGHIIHGNLLSQVNTGDIHESLDLSRDLADIKAGEEPSAVPVRVIYQRKLERTGMQLADMISTVTDAGHHYIFGPIANNIVRDPLFSLDYHLEMERLRNTGLYSDIQMQTMAETNAAMRLTRFVHNPRDKMVVESNMRVIAPFYFAQNQAWRRAFRVLHEDPGAFEKYLKAALGVTQWVSVQSKNGQAPLLHLPGTQVLGWMAGHVPLRNFWSSPYTKGLFDSLGFALTGSPGSISSMDPLGAVNTPTGIAGNIGRPSWGPIFTAPMELAEALFNMSAASSHVSRDMVKGIRGLLGPAANAGGMAGQLDPSSVGRATEGLLHGLGWWGSPESSASFMSDYLLTMNNGADNLMAKLVAQAKAEYLPQLFKQNGIKNTAQNRGEAMGQKAVADYIVGEASRMFSDYMKDPRNFNNFINDARGAALTLQLGKVAATLFSPLSPSIQATFTKEPQFLAIEAEKNPNGSPKYPTYQDALNEFAQRYPGHWLDVSSRSNSPEGAWPETNQTVTWAGKFPQLVSKYGWAAAYLQADPAYTTGGKFNISAYSLLVNLNLRARDTPTQFLDALMVKTGQAYYNWVLKPTYGTEYTKLKQAAQNYGLTENSQWLAYHTGSQYVASDVQTLNQMAEMVSANDVPNSAFYPGTVAQGRAVASDLNKALTGLGYEALPKGYTSVRGGFDYLTQLGKYAIEQYSNKPTTSERNTYAYNFYSQMQSLATKVPVEYRSYVTYVLENLLNRSNL